jgi:hypothetical protein
MHCLVSWLFKTCFLVFDFVPARKFKTQLHFEYRATLKKIGEQLYITWHARQIFIFKLVNMRKIGYLALINFFGRTCSRFSEL